VHTDCVRLYALIQLREGGSGKVRVDLMSYAELTFGLVHVRILEEINKKRRRSVDVAPH
jgi:hypothetical protein